MLWGNRATCLKTGRASHVTIWREREFSLWPLIFASTHFQCWNLNDHNLCKSSILITHDTISNSLQRSMLYVELEGRPTIGPHTLFSLDTSYLTYPMEIHKFLQGRLWWHQNLGMLRSKSLWLGFNLFAASWNPIVGSLGDCIVVI